MKGKCRIKAIILIIQAWILFICCTVGQTASVLCFALTGKTYPHSTLGDSVLCTYFLSHPENSVWPLISWDRGIISIAVRKIPSIWTYPADQRTLEVGIKFTWKVAFSLQTPFLAEVVLRGHFGSSYHRVHMQWPQCPVYAVNKKVWTSLRKLKGRRKSTHVTIDPFWFPRLLINSLNLSSLRAALKGEWGSCKLRADNHCKPGLW